MYEICSREDLAIWWLHPRAVPKHERTHLAPALSEPSLTGMCLAVAEVSFDAGQKYAELTRPEPVTADVLGSLRLLLHLPTVDRGSGPHLVRVRCVSCERMEGGRRDVVVFQPLPGHYPWIYFGDGTSAVVLPLPFHAFRAHLFHDLRTEHKGAWLLNSPVTVQPWDEIAVGAWRKVELR